MKNFFVVPFDFEKSILISPTHILSVLNIPSSINELIFEKKNDRWKMFSNDKEAMSYKEGDEIYKEGYKLEVIDSEFFYLPNINDNVIKDYFLSNDEMKYYFPSELEVKQINYLFLINNKEMYKKFYSSETSLDCLNLFLSKINCSNDSFICITEFKKRASPKN